MNNLKDIHNRARTHPPTSQLFYQDFNEQFEGYTQRYGNYAKNYQGCFIRISMNNLKDIHNHMRLHTITVIVVLSGFQ